MNPPHTHWVNRCSPPVSGMHTGCKGLDKRMDESVDRLPSKLGDVAKKGHMRGQATGGPSQRGRVEMRGIGTIGWRDNQSREGGRWRQQVSNRPVDAGGESRLGGIARPEVGG